MARRRTRTPPPLAVALNGRRVGTLAGEADGAIGFRYAPEWLAWEHAIPVSLSLPLGERRYTGSAVTAVLDNLLPDNDTIRRRVAERVGAGGTDAYSLLAAVGRDCVGALQFLPENVESERPGGPEGEPIDEAGVAALLRGLGRAPLGLGPDEDFRLSIAGAQEKTALLRLKGRWLVPRGTTPTTHILKPAIGRLVGGLDLSLSVENEHACLRFLAALGFPVATTEVAEFAGVRTLVVERFDRVWSADGTRLLRRPQEDCCQALGVPPSLKYEAEGGPGMAAILDLLRSGDEPRHDRRLFVGAQLAFWLLGATDGHAKNFSLFLRSGGRFLMTPLYDVMSAQPGVDRGEIQHNRMKLAMAVGHGRHYVVGTIAPRHFRETAASTGMPAAEVEATIEDIKARLPAAVEELGKLADVPAELAESIARGVEARARLL